jgi:hypothetical protein
LTVTVTSSATTPTSKAASTSTLYPRRSPSTKSPPTATFKGREKELDELTEAIRDGTVAILGRAGDGRDRQDSAGAEAGPTVTMAVGDAVDRMGMTSVKKRNSQ